LTRTWRVIFEGEEAGAADDFELDFYDIRDILNKDFIGLKKEAIDIIKGKIKTEENYHAIGNIKEIIGPEGEDIVEERFLALLGIDKNELRFGFLFAFVEEGILLVAVWPKVYADAVRDNERLLSGVIYYMVERPDNWRRVDMVLPISK